MIDSVTASDGLQTGMAGRELWLASGNRKKLVELQRLLAPAGYRLRLQDEAPVAVTVEEDCPDFAGNAAKKARALALAVGAPSVADDSGLCVDALAGRPGVHSARFGGPGLDDHDRVELLLASLRDVPPAQRGARFVCHLCLVDRTGAVLATFEEECAGHITNTARGEQGFGYDPVFVPRDRPGDAADDPEPPTFAMLSAERKDAISHRGKALRRLARYLIDHPLPTTP